MIYAIGFQQDLVISFLDHALATGKLPPKRIRTLHMESLQAVDLDFHSLQIHSLHTDGEGIVELVPEDRIYLRPYAFAEARRLDSSKRQHLRGWERVYQLLLLSRQCLVGHTALRSESNTNKLLHSSVFDDVLSVPQWRATNTEMNASERTDHVVKSPSCVRAQVVRSLDFLNCVAERSLPPTLIQRQVRGLSVRVTVVGYKHVIAAEIPESDRAEREVDYRYSGSAKIRPRRIELPDDIQERVLVVARRYGLPLCGMDLIRDHQAWHFLEVNPEPGWAFLEEAENLLIAHHLLEFMEGELGRRESLRPDNGLQEKRALAAEVWWCEKESTAYPVALRPTDYMARPGEPHPLWSRA
ncbi:MAG: hypothetical protein AB7G93_18430 [Bdellovibrionales bacterium]